MCRVNQTNALLAHFGTQVWLPLGSPFDSVLFRLSSISGHLTLLDPFVLRSLQFWPVNTPAERQCAVLKTG